MRISFPEATIVDLNSDTSGSNRRISSAACWCAAGIVSAPATGCRELPRWLWAACSGV